MNHNYIAREKELPGSAGFATRCNLKKGAIDLSANYWNEVYPVSYTHLYDRQNCRGRRLSGRCRREGACLLYTSMAAAQVGDHVSVKGRMQSHTFEGQDGKLHRSYDLIAEHVSFIKKER